MTDNVNHPSHYNNGGVECIDAMEAATINKSGAEAICTSNIIKYLWRYEAKNGLEDVKKAQWYINRLIAELEGKAGGLEVTPVRPEPWTCARSHGRAGSAARLTSEAIGHVMIVGSTNEPCNRHPETRWRTASGEAQDHL